MRLHVRAQVRPVCERFPYNTNHRHISTFNRYVTNSREHYITQHTAVRAPERLLASVRALVTLEQPRSTEGLAAHVTPVFEVVSEQVHAEGRHADVNLQRDERCDSPPSLLATLLAFEINSLTRTNPATSCGKRLFEFTSLPKYMVIQARVHVRFRPLLQLARLLDHYMIAICSDYNLQGVSYNLRVPVLFSPIRIACTFLEIARSTLGV